MKNQPYSKSSQGKYNFQLLLCTTDFDVTIDVGAKLLTARSVR